MRTDLVSVTMQYLAMEFSSISGIYYSETPARRQATAKNVNFLFT